MTHTQSEHFKRGSVNALRKESFTLHYIKKLKSAHLCTQALPCNTAHIEANPQLLADQCMGIIVNQLPLNYETFDDVMASGTFESIDPDSSVGSPLDCRGQESKGSGFEPS